MVTLRARDRLVSAMVGAGLMAVATLGLLFAGVSAPVQATSDGIRTSLLILAACSALGIVIAAHLGWTKVDRALSSEPARQTALFVGIRAIVEGAALVAIAMTVGSDWRINVASLTPANVLPEIVAPLLGIVGFALVVWVIGLCVFGLPAIALVAPPVAAWRWTVRLVVGPKASKPADGDLAATR